MPTFGFSAYLKLLCLNDAPRRTLIRQRLQPSTGGYDYHRSLRNLAQRYLIGCEDIAELIEACREITKLSERNSAILGLNHLAQWRLANPGPTVEYAPKMYVSPNSMFQIHFTPNFGSPIGGMGTAVHIWNTMRPALSERMVYAALSLFPDLYAGDAVVPQDLAVLSLREPHIYRLSEAADYSLIGARTVDVVERLIESVYDELELPRPTNPDHRLPPP